MLLQALAQYGQRIVRHQIEADPSRNPHAFKDGVRIDWLVRINWDGSLVDLVDWKKLKAGGSSASPSVSARGLNKVPRSAREGDADGRHPRFLNDKIEFYFGCQLNLTTRSELRFAAHRDLCERFLEHSSGDRRAQAACKFFEKVANGEISVAYDPTEKKDKLRISTAAGNATYAVKDKEILAICVLDDFPKPLFHSSENIPMFWSRHFEAVNQPQTSPSTSTGNVRQSDKEAKPCMCCGAIRERATAVDKVVLPGGNFSLVSYDKPAFQSYGFKKTQNAAICFDCAKLATKGLNQLLKDGSTSLIVKPWQRGEKADSRARKGQKQPSGKKSKGPFAPVKFAFWSKEEVEFDYSKVVQDEPEAVRRFLQSARRGALSTLNESSFYILGLSGSNRRVILRYWTQTSIDQVNSHLVGWFSDLKGEIDERHLEREQRYSLQALCFSTIRESDDETHVPPLVSTSLFLSAFLGKPVPPAVLQLIVNRVRTIPQTDYDKEKPSADYKLKPARMALLRLTLNRLMKDTESKFDVGLDVSRREPEYHCGRLLAVCDDAMRWANGTSTVADRYMGSASTAPCSVLPVVYRNSRHHLNKLKRDIPAKGTQLEKLLDEILSKLTAYPLTLPAQKAGTFILGFHHQRQYFFLVSRYAKLKKQREGGTLPDDYTNELEALEDFVNRSHFDVSLLADLPDEEEPEAPIAEPE